ncbi:hypothetical protein [Salibacter halophilus]|uniref:Uncharacterized protein n=1 Tax=Salibacter halophilus TaxID=1803916 RepID=A0A6N6MA11_9FLAO|nr:hypothetical protein [Salibacter halophilus]KAB1065090.1 hypothetical protein F3059_03830 [Salibacter halophilus]
MMRSLLLYFFIVFFQVSLSQDFGNLNISVVDSNDSATFNYDLYLSDSSNVTVQSWKSIDRNELLIDSLASGIYSVKVTKGESKEIVKGIIVRAGKITFITVKIKPVETERSCDFVVSDKKPKCHVCKSRKHIIKYAYGLPTKKTLELAKQEKLKLGGCVIQTCQPRWYCTKDQVDIINK